MQLIIFAAFLNLISAQGGNGNSNGGFGGGQQGFGGGQQGLGGGQQGLGGGQQGLGGGQQGFGGGQGGFGGGQQGFGGGQQGFGGGQGGFGGGQQGFGGQQGGQGFGGQQGGSNSFGGQNSMGNGGSGGRPNGGGFGGNQNSGFGGNSMQRNFAGNNQCISLKGSRNCPTLDNYFVYPSSKYTDLEGLDNYLDSTKYNGSSIIDTFQNQLQCPQFNGRGGRYGMSSYCAYLVSDSETKCSSQYPQGTKTLTLCAPVCNMHMESLRAIFANSDVCDANVSPSVQNTRDSVLKPKNNLAEYCDNLTRNPASEKKDTCWPGIKSEFFHCGFEYPDETLNFCRENSSDPCCAALKAFIESQKPKTPPAALKPTVTPADLAPTATATATSTATADTSSQGSPDRSGTIFGIVAIVVASIVLLVAGFYMYRSMRNKGNKDLWALPSNHHEGGEQGGKRRFYQTNEFFTSSGAAQARKVDRMSTILGGNKKFQSGSSEFTTMRASEILPNRRPDNPSSPPPRAFIEKFRKLRGTSQDTIRDDHSVFDSKSVRQMTGLYSNVGKPSKLRNQTTDSGDHSAVYDSYYDERERGLPSSKSSLGNVMSYYSRRD